MNNQEIWTLYATTEILEVFDELVSDLDLHDRLDLTDISLGLMRFAFEELGNGRGKAGQVIASLNEETGEYAVAALPSFLNIMGTDFVDSPQHKIAQRKPPVSERVILGHIALNSEYVKNINELVDGFKLPDCDALFTEAVSFAQWMSLQIKKNQAIASVNQKTGNYITFDFPIFNAVRPDRPDAALEFNVTQMIAKYGLGQG